MIVPFSPLPSSGPDRVLERMRTLHPKAIDLSLDRVHRLLDRLGNPEQALPPTVHVAGTNGKGSVVAYLRAFAEAAGLTAHVYTSPHLVRFNERIRVAGRLLDDDHLTDLLEEVEGANEGRPITFFEITTCAAFLIFSRVPADVVLLETGLGGRLDATNVLKRPALTVLTPISLDHEQYLGGHIEGIAAEKSHILKPGVGCVTAKQSRAVAAIIEMRSLEMGAPVWREGHEWFIRSHSDDTLVFDGARGSLALPPPALPGPHQVRNAGLAVAAIERLPMLGVGPRAIARGLETVEWPGRLQRLTLGPLLERLPEGWEIWLDGGHNPAAGEALSKHGRNWRDKPLHLILGMLKTKDAGGFIKPLAARVHHLRTVTIPGQDAAISADELAATAIARGCHEAKTAPDVAGAVHDIVAEAGEPGRILITGSLYLVGDVLARAGL
ncbi:MAG: bifunctional folylpolyglutamate synthase/dihydrofolate synthase [Alphaproteobacteria bacterium]|nr:bifunctional folylpolyglutamate synthase/dihydrofolate synthase [Alphaproteobacteria bacterium]